MNSKMTVGIVVAAVCALVVPGMAGAATSTPITITSSTGVPNRVGDNETPLAHDGNLATGTYTTPSSTIADPSYLEFGFASTLVNRIRLYKNNEYGPHDLTIQYSTGTEPLADRTWTTVSGLANGYGGTSCSTRLRSTPTAP